jgi:DNA polymerase-3 subunit gamma/tau
MSSSVFYRKWRPQVLNDVLGQEPITQTLLNALSTGRTAHAYLFCGPRGTGKTSTARILAKAVNCLSHGNGEPCNTCAMCVAITEGHALDVIEIDAASNTGVEDIRGLREKVNYAPNQARFKVYIIDEVHMLSNAAANALLKTLEEPPPHVIFILATTEVHKILATIMSRCQRFDFRRLALSHIVAEISRVCQGEGITMDTEAMRLVARSATGSMRDALNLLEQLTAYYGSDIGLRQVQATLGISGDHRVKELARHIVDGNIAGGMAAINSVNNDGMDLRQFNRELVEYLRALLLARTNAGDSLDFTPDDIAELKTLAARSTLDRIVIATRLFGQLGARFDNYSTLPLELALVDAVMGADDRPPPARPVETPSPAAKAPIPPASPAAGAIVKPTPQPGPATGNARVAPSSRPQPAGAPASSRLTATPVSKPAAATLAGTPMEVTSEIERLKVNWKLIIKQVPADVQKAPAVAVLRGASVRPISLEGSVVCLAFAHKIHKEMIEKIENQRVTERVVSDFLGRPCQIKCILEEDHLVKEALKMGAQITNVEEK